MAEKMKIIPLGGLNEIGKNMTVYEHGGEIIVVDCGMGFPDGDMYGIDLVIPDVTYLVKNKGRIRGLFITHGHEDHIGAIPYILKQVNMPVYCTRLTAGLIKLKLEEHRLLDRTRLITCEAGQVVKAGKFSVEFIHVNHSIADAVAFAIKCPVGTGVHTGDFKIDCTDRKAVLLLNAANPRQENLEEDIVHELMHLKLYPLDQVTESLIVSQFEEGTPARSFAYRQFFESLEVTVEELTKCFLLEFGEDKELSFGRCAGMKSFNELFEGLNNLE